MFVRLCLFVCLFSYFKITYNSCRRFFFEKLELVAAFELVDRILVLHLFLLHVEYLNLCLFVLTFIHVILLFLLFFHFLSLSLSLSLSFSFSPYLLALRYFHLCVVFQVCLFLCHQERCVDFSCLKLPNLILIFRRHEAIRNEEKSTCLFVLFIHSCLLFFFSQILILIILEILIILILIHNSHSHSYSYSYSLHLR